MCIFICIFSLCSTFVVKKTVLKITERIKYKLLSLTYKVLTTTQPSYLHNLFSVQPPCSTRSSSLIILARPPSSSSLRITDLSFQYASPCLWHQLPSSLRQSHFILSVSYLPAHAATISHCQLTSLTTHNSLSFTPGSKATSFTNLSHHRLSPSLRTDHTDFMTGPFLLSILGFLCDCL